MHASHSNIRKAAILVAAVDRRTADLLLRQMEPTQAAAVRRAAVQLDNVDPSERDAVLVEFRQLAARADVGNQRRQDHASAPARRRGDSQRLMPSRQPSGIDLCSPEVRTLREPVDDALVLSTDPEASEGLLGSRATEWLRRAGSDALAEFLAREHPQTIAVVFTRLAPRQAAEVLTRLPGELQAAVVQRLSDLDEADPTVIREVECGLESWLAEQLARSARRSAGLSAVARILDAVEIDCRHSVLANLARLDANLAMRLEGTPHRTLSRTSSSSLSFDDLLKLDDATLAEVVAAAEDQVAVLALAGAAEEVLSRVIRHVPAQRAAELREGVANLGPARLRDLETSQQRLVELAVELEARSRIDLTPLRTCSVVA